MPTEHLNLWTNYHFPPAARRDFPRRHWPASSSDIGQFTEVESGRRMPPIRRWRRRMWCWGNRIPMARRLAARRVKWVHLTSAGYDRYDRPDLRAAFKSRRAALTTSSGVYEEPCAEHVFAMMLSLARQLPQCQDTQRQATTPGRRRSGGFIRTCCSARRR